MASAVPAHGDIQLLNESAAAADVEAGAPKTVMRAETPSTEERSIGPMSFSGGMLPPSAQADTCASHCAFHGDSIW